MISPAPKNIARADGQHLVLTHILSTGQNSYITLKQYLCILMLNFKKRNS
jgi:hypothetical protein